MGPLNEEAATLQAAGGEKGKTAHYKDEVDCQDVLITQDAPQILFAAAHGDLRFLVREVARGENLLVADYDMRTPLHLAACEGHVDIVKYILTQARATGNPSKTVLAKDRFGHTAYDDCLREKQPECAELLKEWNLLKLAKMTLFRR